jgi:hypothetical protein
MSGKTKLELTWIGKDERPRLEPRILLEDPEKSYHGAHRVGENDHFDNRLIFGDNLLALKALEQEFTGKIKCIYIEFGLCRGLARPPRVPRADPVFMGSGAAQRHDSSFGELPPGPTVAHYRTNVI